MPHAGFLVKEERKNRNYWSCLSYSTDAMLSWTETGPKTISGPYPCSYFGAGAGAGPALVFGSRNRTRIPSQEPEPDPCSYFGPGTAFVFRSRDRTRKTDALGHHTLLQSRAGQPLVTYIAQGELYLSTALRKPRKYVKFNQQYFSEKVALSL